MGSLSQRVMAGTGGQGLCDSHLGVSHWGLTGRVSVSCRGGIGPIFCSRLVVDCRLVEGLLGKGSYRHKGVGLILLIHLERLRLKEVQTTLISVTVQTCNSKFHFIKVSRGSWSKVCCCAFSIRKKYKFNIQSM